MGRSTVTERLKTFKNVYGVENAEVGIVNMMYDKSVKIRVRVYRILFDVVTLIRKYGSWQTILDMLNFAEEVKQYGTYQQAIEYMKHHKAAEDKEELDKLISGKWGSE